MFHSSFATFFYVAGTATVAGTVDGTVAVAAVAVVDCSNLNFDVVITLVNVQGSML